MPPVSVLSGVTLGRITSGGVVCRGTTDVAETEIGIDKLLLCRMLAAAAI